jgi:proline iminopeptidase
MAFPSLSVRQMACLAASLVLLPVGFADVQPRAAEARQPIPARQPAIAVSQRLLQADADGYLRTADSVTLYYRTIGAGPDTIVVLHGGSGLDMGYLTSTLLPLSRNHTLLLYDQRGAGRSTVLTDSGAISLSAHITDLEAIRDAFGIKRMILLGHSWGAMLAAQYALRHQRHVGRLILVDAGPPRRSPYFQQFLANALSWMDSTARARFETLSAALDTATQPVPVCRAIRELWIPGLLVDRSDTLLLSRLVEGGCTAPPNALRNRNFVGRLTIQSLGDWDWRRDFRHVAVPVLIIQGEKDPIPLESAREWQRAFPAATLIVLEGAGHYSYADRPEAFVNAVSAFLH